MNEETWQRFGPEVQQMHIHANLDNNNYTPFSTTDWNYATRVRMHLNIEDVAGNKKDIISNGNLKARINKNGKIVLVGDDDNEVEIASVGIASKIIRIYDELPTNTPIEKLVKEQMEKILERSGIL